MTAARRSHGSTTIFTARDCLERAVTNLAAAETQLGARELQLAERGFSPTAEHTRNRIELGSAWSLVAEALITEGT